MVQYGERSKKTSYSAPSVQKAFKILQAIADSSSGLGVSELAKRLNIGKSTVHGITSSLEALGVLVRNPIDKRFHVGYTLLELGRRAYGKIELREVARGPMERLMEKVEETIFLGIMNGDHITILDVVESHKELKITSPPGTRLPLLAGATGKVFLSQFDEKRAREMIEKVGLPRFTAKSVTDPKRFLKEAREVKARGYAIDDEEYLAGVRAIAAPIPMGPHGFAAIWAVGFTSSLDDRKMEIAIGEIQKTAQEISQKAAKRMRV